MNERLNYKGVCRTAPVVECVNLLIFYLKFGFVHKTKDKIQYIEWISLKEIMKVELFNKVRV